MIGQQKNNKTLYHQNYHLIEKPVIIFEIQMHFRIILEYFDKYKCSGIAFSLQTSRYVSNEQPCLKTNGLYDDLLLLSRFFSLFVSHSGLLFYLVYVFQFLHLSLMFFLRPLNQM